MAYRTVISFGDTQHMVTTGEQNLADFEDMVDWIIANKDTENIDFVLHPGDCIDMGEPLPLATPEELIYGYGTLADVDAEWTNFNSQMDRLETARIPYILCKGNHDNVGEAADITADLDTNGFPFYYSTAHWEAMETAFASSDRFFEHEIDSSTSYSGMSHVFRVKIGDTLVRVIAMTSIGDLQEEIAFAVTEVGKNQDIPARVLCHWLGDDGLYDGVDTAIVTPMRSVAPQLFGVTMGHTWEPQVGVERIGLDARDKISRVVADFSTGNQGDQAWLVRERYHQDAQGNIIGYSADMFNPITSEVRTGPGNVVSEQPFTIGLSVDNKDNVKVGYTNTDAEVIKIRSGQRMQMGQNLGKQYVYLNTQAFNNLVKSGNLRTNSTGNSHDVNGYIDSTPGGVWEHNLHNGTFILAGGYVLRWTGTCTITLRDGFGTVITPDSSSANRQTYTLAADDGSLFLRMEGGTCTNLEFIGPDEETNFDAGDILTAQFKTDLSGVVCVRGMDWCDINFSVVRDVADMSDHDYIIWANDLSDYPGIIGGVSYKTMALVAEELDVDLWVNLHHQMTDAAITAAANETWNNLSAGWKASHKIYLEYSNELWRAGFRDQWQWAQHLNNPLVDATMTPSTGSVSSATHGFSTGDTIVTYANTTHKIRPYANGYEIKIVVDDVNTFRVLYSDVNADFKGDLALLNATQDNPCALTVTSVALSNLANGDTVHVGTGGGMSELEGIDYTIANLQIDTPSAGQTTFELSGINSTEYTAYSTGGECYKMVPSDYIDSSATVISYREADPLTGMPYIAQHVAAKCVEVWDLWDAVTGADALYHVGTGQAANYDWYLDQLDNAAFRARHDVYAIAPYVTFRDAGSILTKSFAQLTDYMIDVHGPGVVNWVKQHMDLSGLYRIVLYECGEENSWQQWSTAEEAHMVAWARSSEATRFYDWYCKALADERVTLFMHYNSHDSSYSKSGTWGSMETAGDTTAAKYLGIVEFLQNGGVPKS